MSQYLEPACMDVRFAIRPPSLTPYGHQESMWPTRVSFKEIAASLQERLRGGDLDAGVVKAGTERDVGARIG